MITVTPLGDDWKSAVRDVRAVLADAMTTPPSKEEIAREVAEFDISYKVPVETQETQAGSKLADEIAEAVDIRETVANPDTVYAHFQDRPSRCLPPRPCWQHTRALFAGTVERAILITPKPSDGTAQDVRLAITDAGQMPHRASRVSASEADISRICRRSAPRAPWSTTVPTGLLGIERHDAVERRQGAVVAQ